MPHLQNLHTHSTWCDGRDTPEQVLEMAMEKGFCSIGFSSHSRTATYPVPAADGAEYKAAIRALAEQYRDRIEVFCGLEVDSFHTMSTLEGYDYLIGSVHHVRNARGDVGVDRSEETVREGIRTLFDGDGLAYAKAYYAALAELPSAGSFDIVGHFDLLCKHAENTSFFDPFCKEYERAAFEAIDALAGKIPFFEVNTGAIARGYRKTPYPFPNILRELKRRGFGAVISSDCHDARYLDCCFAQATALLRACGFTEQYILTQNGFQAIPLEGK